MVKKYDRLSQTEAHIGSKTQLLVDANTSATVSHLLQSLPVGLYASDPEGNILFINYRLESWLGYAQNEIMSRDLTLYDLIPQDNTSTAEGLLLRDCEGIVTFLTKERKGLNLHVTQEITRAENGAAQGSVAIISAPENIEDSPAETPLSVAARRPQSSSF